MTIPEANLFVRRRDHVTGDYSNGCQWRLLSVDETTGMANLETPTTHKPRIVHVALLYPTRRGEGVLAEYRRVGGDRCLR